MNLSIWLSRRLSLTATGSKANSTGAAIAIIGVAIAILVMECTLACTLGFKHQITQRLMGFDGQVTVLPAYDYNTALSETYISDNDSIDAIIRQALPQAQKVLKFKQPGMLKTDNDFSGTYFVAYSPDYDYAFESNFLIDGEMPDYSKPENSNRILLSKMLAQALNLKVGDRPYAYFFVDDAVKTRRFDIAGIYESGFSDYDKSTIFLSMDALQGVAGIESGSGSQISISGLDVDDIEDAAARLQNAFIEAYHSGQLQKLYPVDNVKHTGATFFNWLALLDTNVVVIFILMACVSGFTLISSMFIIILDRIPAIGLLRALGATKRQIRLTFINLAMKTVGLGLLFGNIIGIGLLLAQQHWHLVKLDPDMYFLPYAPVEINWWAFATLNLAVIAAAWFLLILPSRAAANVPPSRTMRFE